MHRAAEWDAAGAAALTPRLERYGRGAGPVWEPRVKASAAIAYLLAGDRARAERLFAELAGQVALPTMAAFEFMSLEWYEELRQSLAETLRGARAEGNLHRIAWNRTCAAHLELRFGRLHAAEVAAAEAIPLGEVLVNPKMDLAAAALAGVQAWRGQADSCLANARRAAASARAQPTALPRGSHTCRSGSWLSGREGPARRSSSSSHSPDAGRRAPWPIRRLFPSSPTWSRPTRSRGRPERLESCSNASRVSPAPRVTR